MVCVGAVGMHHFRRRAWARTAAALVGSDFCPVAIVRDQGHREGPQLESSSTSAVAENSVLLGIAIEEARLRNAR